MDTNTGISTENKSEIKEQGKIKYFCLQITREVISIFFWVYAVTKVFIFDLDVVLLKYLLPEYYWLLKYKFVLLISVVAIVWLFTKNKSVIFWFLYILFYPIILVFWKLPKFVFKQKSWVLALAVINSTLSFFSSIKYKFIISTVFITSFFGVFIFSNKKLVSSFCLLIFISLLVVYFRYFIKLFKPSGVFQLYKKFFSGVVKHGKTFFAIEEGMRGLPTTSYGEKQLDKWVINLQSSVLYNRVCLFFAKKLKYYQYSGVGVASSALNILALLTLTIFCFGVINFGVNKLDSGYFELSKAPSFFIFIYYSFNGMFFNSIKEVTPINPISQTISMVELFFAFFIATILITLVFTHKNQKRFEEIDTTIKDIEEQGSLMEKFIADEYKFSTIYEAMAELEKLKSGLAKFIFKISEGLK